MFFFSKFATLVKAEEEAEKNREKEELMKEQAVASQAKTKSAISMSGDILIENFDLTFGAQQLIQNAELNLAQGKRYGLVGRNGAGKSTLLRALDARGLSLPTNITVLHVEQEVIGRIKYCLLSTKKSLADCLALNLAARF